MNKRDISIDRFRGFAVITMIIIQIWRDFNGLEILSKLGSHRASDGITIIEGMRFADVFAPMFLFAVALTYKRSFDRRCATDGQTTAIKHFVIRYISLIGVGGLLRGAESLIYYFGHGYVEHRIDYLFFLGIFILIVMVALKAITSRILPNRTKIVFSQILFASLCFLATLCIISSARDFFYQLVVQSDSIFKPWGYWEALQAIGAAGIITLLFIRYETLKRFIIATVFLLIYAIFHETGNHAELISIYAQQGGFFGIIGQSCIVLYGTVLADLYNRDTEKLTRYLLALPVFGVVGLIAVQYIPPTMRSVSPSYILINIFISGTVFLVFCLYRFVNIRFDILALFGKNPLAMYILQYVLIYGVKELIGYDTIRNASDLYAMTFTVIMMFILTFIAFLLDRKEIVLKF